MAKITCDSGATRLNLQKLQRQLYADACITLRFWWTESPLKSPQKSARESKPTQKKALESKCTLMSPQKRAPIFCLAPKRAQEIAQKSKTLKKALKRVGFSNKCSGECVIQKRAVLKRVCYS